MISLEVDLQKPSFMFDPYHCSNINSPRLQVSFRCKKESETHDDPKQTKMNTKFK